MIPIRVQKQKVSRNATAPKLLQAAAEEIENLHFVAPGIVRGAQPTPQGLKLLSECGVKTIINLRNEESIVNREAEEAEKLGMQFVNIPLDVFAAPSAVAIKAFIAIAGNPINQPVFVHCQHGLERTGTMIGLYRIHREGWSGGQAYDEMLEHGFRPTFFNLSLTVMDYCNRRETAAQPPAKPRNSVELLGRGKGLAGHILRFFVRLHQVRKDPVEYGTRAVIGI
jgi:tyrosine-protein phosphatase SIW14